MIKVCMEFDSPLSCHVLTLASPEIDPENAVEIDVDERLRLRKVGYSRD
jgi:hypothetical protein